MSLTAFLAQNAKKVENVKYVVSNRFVDEEGKPVCKENNVCKEKDGLTLPVASV